MRVTTSANIHEFVGVISDAMQVHLHSSSPHGQLDSMAVHDSHLLSRRQFVAGSAAALVACSRPSRSRSSAIDVGQFLALSRVLLHPAEPDPALAASYLQALGATEQSYSLAKLAAELGKSPDPAGKDVGELVTRLPHPEARKLADEIIAAWYSGVVNTAAGPVLVTWSGALAWRVIPGINAPSECGGAPGTWSNAPMAMSDGYDRE